MLKRLSVDNECDGQIDGRTGGRGTDILKPYSADTPISIKSRAQTDFQTC